MKKLDQLIEKWDAIHADWTANIAFIRGRPNFYRIWDVTAHSVLKFKFQGRPVTRGWVETLIAGDTKCGKSEVAEKLNAFVGISKPVVCEAASFAGVVGGIKEVGGRQALSWGALPLLDRRMAVLDEVTGLTVDQISSMSGLRSSGVASIIKIETERASARVRKLWLSNPRTDRNRRVSTYPFGCLVIPEIIGRAEDISRFDCALVASSEEVPLEVLNAKRYTKVKHVHTAEAAKALIFWAWTRQPEHVIWTDGTEDAVVDLAMEQCRKYNSQIPLVEPGEQRFRVARLAVSLAARFHSTDRGGENVLIKPEHVALAGWFMASCFDSPVTGYRAFSQTKAETEALIQPPELEQMLTKLLSHKDVDVALDSIWMSEDLSRLPVMEFNRQSGLLADLVRFGLLETGQDGKLYKTRKFLEFYRNAASRVRKGAATSSSKERF